MTGAARSQDEVPRHWDNLLDFQKNAPAAAEDCHARQTPDKNSSEKNRQIAVIVNRNAVINW